ncbi:Hypothetical predicted protein [Mytilus galloprovincialis]|uniref:Uncharacterized protein n=1 Tax=Mytilus galloprovincialis TaxID=29158 RepID=A0A8B6ESZ4_MYTGA|nr:Hypothetical predicted protein [Mytilus galloprovincialis]
MDEDQSTSCGIKRHISPELQNHIDVIAAKCPRKEANPSDLDDDQKRWLVVGICINSVISPALRKHVDSILTVFHNELIRYYKIDTQIYPGHLQKDPQTGVYLNYEVVNNNKDNYGKNKAQFDYTVKDAIDLSKLFLQTHMAHYRGFDETCDSSALLGLILNIAKFDPVIKSDAYDVRTKLRNPWAHCDFTGWDAVKYSNSFQLMRKLVKDLKLSINEEKLIIEEIEKWEKNVRIKKELGKFEIIFNKIAQLDEEIKKGFSGIDETSKTNFTNMNTSQTIAVVQNHKRPLDKTNRQKTIRDIYG